MIDIKVTTLGGPEIAAKLAQADSGIRDAIREELALVGEEIVSRAQSLAPKRTGIMASRVAWYFGREMQRGPRANRVTRVVDVNWSNGRIEFTVRPRGRVAHLVERGVNATFYQRTGQRRGQGSHRRGRAEIGPFAGEAMHGPDWRYSRTVRILARPFFMPAVESVGGASGVNARLQQAVGRAIASANTGAAA